MDSTTCLFIFSFLHFRLSSSICKINSQSS